MKQNKYQKTCEEILKHAGIKLNGSNPWDIKIKDPTACKTILAQGSMGLGESYMKDQWECKDISGFIEKVQEAKLGREVISPKIIMSAASAKISTKLSNQQTIKKSKKVGEQHYDVGNDLYKIMLDKRMVYTCGYWKNAKTLDEAQEAKLDLICKKIGLKPGMKVLDIGCGWGSFAKFAAKKYKVKVVGITISKEQVKLGKENCKGLPVEIRLQDYRDINEKFDRIVSIGMFEHVGPKNYRKYMKVAHKCLKDDGLFLLHTIGKHTSSSGTDPWINKYIFPGGVLPNPSQISDSIQDLFIFEDWHCFGTDYDKTLMAWHANFQKGWNKLKSKYSPEFKRMWEYYLLSCAGTFRARKIDLWQIVLSKNGVKKRYNSIR